MLSNLSWRQNHVMTSKSSSWYEKHIMTSKNLLWYQKHVFIILCSWNNEKNMSRRQKAGNGVQNTSCQQNIKIHHDVISSTLRNKVRQDVKKLCCQVPWRQNVLHDINKWNKRHSAKTFVTSKICHVINKSWCYKVRHDVNTRHDDKKNSSLLRKVHVRHYVKSSSWREKGVMMSKRLLWCQQSFSWSQ